MVSDDLQAVKLCDFGVSRVKTQLQQTMTMNITATQAFMAPETLLKGVNQNFETDMWAAGTTILEIFLQRDPWDRPPAGVTLAEFMRAQMNEKKAPHALAALQQKSSALYRKTKPLLSYVEKKRPTAKEAYEDW